MALSTYTELRASIADWLNRSDLTDATADFISLAEAQIERTLRTRQMIVRANITIADEYVTAPGDFLETRTLKLTSTNPNTPLEFMTMEALDEEATRHPGSGRPKFFGIVGSQFRVAPTPDATYTAELVYFANLNKLSDSVATNFLLASSPDAYLYGALLQAAPYLKDDERISVWAGLYERALNDLKVADDRAATSGGKLLTRAKSFG